MKYIRYIFFFNQKTAYEMRISDWSSDVYSSDLESGYPPESSETMWAVPLGDGRYILDNIPFYAKFVSDGDVISASVIDGDLTFQEVLEASRNCTIRIITLDDSDGAEVRNILENIGCKVEG